MPPIAPVVFVHADSDDDVLRITKRDDARMPLRVAICAYEDGNGERAVVYLTPAAVTSLRAKLAEFDPTAKTMAVVVDREYRLLPNSKDGVGDRTRIAENVTRVRAESGIDSDGDVDVYAVDGDVAGQCFYVSPAYLAPLDEEPAPVTEAPDQLDPRRVAALMTAAEFIGQGSGGYPIIGAARFLLGELNATDD
ncbi:hypothetical protein AB0H43_02885 [Hamadaea sp. NPDC050747]|uniref:hypothetical protein n=1 Tax=Hamadaea sp. NPDC050747 TaxID=3155789 RepID=UPI0034063F13